MIPETPSQPTLPEEQQEHIEEKPETGKRVLEFLGRTKFLDIRKSDEQFNEWLQKLSYEEYRGYLTRLNGILCEVPIKKRGVEDNFQEIVHPGTGSVWYIPPAVPQREGLMREVFDALKQLPDNEDRALLAYYALQAIHPYSDGNGRTGRLLYQIISQDGKELTEEKLSEFLNHEEEGHAGAGRGREAFAEKVMAAHKAEYYINREVIKDALGDDYLKEYGGMNVGFGSGGSLSEAIKEKLPEEQRVLVEKILIEGEESANHFPVRGVVLLKLLREKENSQKYQYEAKRTMGDKRGMIPEDAGKKISGIYTKELMADLTEDDARRLIEIHAEMKMKFIETMIDIFTNPENHQIKTESGESIPIKNVFRL